MEARSADPVRERSALYFALGAVFLWSSVATGFKLGLAVLAVEQLLLLGTACSWLVFAIYGAATGNLRIGASDLSWAAALGCLNPFAYYLVLFAAYDRLPAYVAQPLNYTWAITLALLAVPILKQKLTSWTLIGIGVSYAGVVVLLTTSTPPAASGWDWFGVALALGSTVLWASYWLLHTLIGTRTDAAPVTLLFYGFGIALPLVALVCVLGPGWPPVTAATLGYGAWVGCIEMGITFLLWQEALRRTTNAARLGQLIFLSPFLSLVMIYFVLGERFGWGAFAGLAIIVAGLVLERRGRG